MATSENAHLRNRSLADCRASKDMKDAFMLRWLEYFTAEGPKFTGPAR